MKRFEIRLVGLTVALAGLSLSSCSDDGTNPLSGVPGPLKELAKQCGIDVDCEAGGIAEGNASISGVPSVDAFFQSVINFQGVAGNVSGGIDAELQAIGADFGVAADGDIAGAIQAEISANVEGSLTVEAEPAKCQVDASATLEAQARCDASFEPGSAMVACEGSCEVEASADVDCGAEADLKCTVTAPSVACEGECKGSCDVDVSAGASCEGTCKGSCDGTCELMNAQGECQGKCDGMCMGSCETELTAEASCEGTCNGECTVTNPEAGCEGGIRASCDAHADAMVMCEGRCEGNFEPPMASAECDASAKAEAKLNVECTPPRLAVRYELKAGLDAQAQAEFEAKIQNLVTLRLPKLMASVKKADLVLDAGGELSASATGAVKGALKNFDASGNLRVQFGLLCAAGQLDAVGSALGGATSQLEGSVSAAAKVTGAVGL
jgi:hypothetical protein